jgi:general secretion pathway protein D
MTHARETSSVTKVPLLGDIPVLGHLFKYTTRSRKRSNLVILMTPYIIKDQLDLAMIQERKQREHDEFVTSFHALGRMTYEPQIDYSRKRGVIEEINRQVQAVEEDVAARASVAAPTRVTPGPL